ncbi:MAG: hypothetical protein J5730_01495 [Bacteroidales bacterium]|nr:hypothetical protein [Bacteroidales bacterium]
MKDKELEDVFARYQPALGNPKEYMTQLSKKLEAVEYAKQYKNAQVRRYRRMLVVVFIAGIITGGISILLALLSPAWMVETENATFFGDLMTIFPKVAAILALCFVSLGFTGLVAQLAEFGKLFVPLRSK